MPISWLACGHAASQMSRADKTRKFLSKLCVLISCLTGAQKRIGHLETQLAQRKADVSALRQKLLSGELTVGPAPRDAAVQPAGMQIMYASIPAAAVPVPQASATVWALSRSSCRPQTLLASLRGCCASVLSPWRCIPCPSGCDAASASSSPLPYPQSPLLLMAALLAVTGHCITALMRN